MKPVDQTRFAINVPLTEPPGNCWAACIASILELDLQDVPDEADCWKPGMSHRESWRLYEPEVHRWLGGRGLLLVEVKHSGLFYSGEVFNPFCIISGPSPRNPEFNHAVVGCGTSVVHDPHKSRGGVILDDLNRVFYELFVPIDPSKKSCVK